VDLGPPGVMSVVAVVVFGGSRGNLIPLQVAIRRVVAWVGDASLEALLPEGGRNLQLPCSGGSVSGVHADGGTPDGDFTNEGRGRVAARRCAHRLRAVLGGVASNLSGEVNHQLGPRGQVLAPNGMIMKRLRYAGKPRQRSQNGRCGLWQAPVEHGGYVAGGMELSSGGGHLRVEEWVLPGLTEVLRRLDGSSVSGAALYTSQRILDAGVRARQATEPAVTFDTAGQLWRLGLTPKPTSARGDVAHIERRRIRQRDASGRTRTVVH
jgi:hypothetical protein